MIEKERQCIQAASDFRVKYARGFFGKSWAVMVRLKHNLTTQPLPENKSVWWLWHMHGVQRGRYGDVLSIELLNQWLDILYGAGAAKRLDIEGRCHQEGVRHAKANIPYYTEENAPHFYFGNPFDNVLVKISRELPPYA